MNLSNPLTLSYAERALIGAFRQCDTRGKHMIFACALDEVEECPKLRPQLTLVPNCGSKPGAERSAAKG